MTSGEITAIATAIASLVVAVCTGIANIIKQIQAGRVQVIQGEKIDTIHAAQANQSAKLQAVQMAQVTQGEVIDTIHEKTNGMLKTMQDSTHMHTPLQFESVMDAIRCAAARGTVRP